MTDTSGIAFNYELDTTIQYKEHPRITASDTPFRIQAINDSYKLFTLEDSTTHQTILNFTNSYELKLIHEDTGTLKMKKFTSPSNTYL